MARLAEHQFRNNGPGWGDVHHNTCPLTRHFRAWAVMIARLPTSHTP